MEETSGLAEKFEANRPRLRAIAHRMLGSRVEAEDAVQESWIRLSRTGEAIDNLGGWLTTVTSRVCLDMLRSRKTRREDAIDDGDEGGGMDIAVDDQPSPERDAIVADRVGTALLTVLDTLAPGERVAFVLHDVFDLPFDDVARILDRSEAATRQLASRARRRLQGADASAEADRARKRAVVEAFLTASKSGDLAGLLNLLHPDAVLRADPVTVKMGSAAITRGAEAVAQTFAGRAKFAELGTIDGEFGALWSAGGETRVAFAFSIRDGRIAGIELLGDPTLLRELKLARVI